MLERVVALLARTHARSQDTLGGFSTSLGSRVGLGCSSRTYSFYAGMGDKNAAGKGFYSKRAQLQGRVLRAGKEINWKKLILIQMTEFLKEHTKTYFPT